MSRTRVDNHESQQTCPTLRLIKAIMMPDSDSRDGDLDSVTRLHNPTRSFFYRAGSRWTGYPEPGSRNYVVSVRLHCINNQFIV
jgi:hypothetical protein